MGSTIKEIVVRSMNEKMYMSMRTATLYQAVNDEGWEAESLLAAMSAAWICVAI
jgi:hypothetical protein